MIKNNRFPNLFIVGSQKCGTTAIAEYFRSHPDIFVPLQKEPWYFCNDLSRNFKKIDLDYYLNMYEKSDRERYLLDASPLYIKSKSAVDEILKVSPYSKIIIMIRNPIELVYSLYFQLKYNREEDAKTFEDAISLQKVRKKDPEATKNFLFPLNAQYFEIGKTCDDIDRYLRRFGSNNVKIIIFDDFKRDTRSVYIELLRFIGLEIIEPESFEVVNPHKKSKTKILNKIATGPPGWMGKWSSFFLSKEQRWKIRMRTKTNKYTVSATGANVFWNEKVVVFRI